MTETTIALLLGLVGLITLTLMECSRGRDEAAERARARARARLRASAAPATRPLRSTPTAPTPAAVDPVCFCAPVCRGRSRSEGRRV